MHTQYVLLICCMTVVIIFFAALTKKSLVVDKLSIVRKFMLHKECSLILLQVSIYINFAYSFALYVLTRTLQMHGKDWKMLKKVSKTGCCQNCKGWLFLALSCIHTTWYQAGTKAAYCQDI